MPRKSGFLLPEIQSKTVSKTTRTIYHSHLNKLAKFGWKSISDLIAHDAEIVKHIETTHVNESSQKFRIYYSAVFYALADSEYIRSPNPYYVAFQTHKDPIVAS